MGKEGITLKTNTSKFLDGLLSEVNRTKGGRSVNLGPREKMNLRASLKELRDGLKEEISQETSPQESKADAQKSTAQGPSWIRATPSQPSFKNSNEPSPQESKTDTQESTVQGPSWIRATPSQPSFKNRNEPSPQESKADTKESTTEKSSEKPEEGPTALTFGN